MADMERETRIIRSIVGVTSIPSDDPTKPTVLTLKGQTETGPLDVRITQIAAQELLAVLNRHPLARGSS